MVYGAVSSNCAFLFIITVYYIYIYSNLFAKVLVVAFSFWEVLYNLLNILK
jgi:hypothetical protein